MVKAKGLKLGGSSQLSKVQDEILSMIINDSLTPPKIAKLRGTSLTAVYKTINILKKKGALNFKYKKVEKKRCTTTSNKIKQIRLHAQEFNIKIIKKGKHYDKYKNRSNTIIIDDNTIRLYENSIEVYSGKSFFSEEVNKATAKSFDYWNRFFIRLENDLDVLIVKSRTKNINLVKHHYAYINNGVVKDWNENDIRIRIYATEDNKLWFESDDSLNYDEVETVHKKTASQDMNRVVQPFFNDLRDNFPEDVPTMTNILNCINKLSEQNLETAKGLNAVVQLIKAKEPKPIEPSKDDFIADYFG